MPYEDKDIKGELCSEKNILVIGSKTPAPNSFKDFATCTKKYT